MNLEGPSEEWKVEESLSSRLFPSERVSTEVIRIRETNPKSNSKILSSNNTVKHSFLDEGTQIIVKVVNVLENADDLTIVHRNPSRTE